LRNLRESPMHSVVYKSPLKPDTYVFLREEGVFDALPAPLRETLGRLVKVMDLELTAERKLARVDVAEVMSALQTRGYFLQMPPTD